MSDIIFKIMDDAVNLYRTIVSFCNDKTICYEISVQLRLSRFLMDQKTCGTSTNPIHQKSRDLQTKEDTKLPKEEKNNWILKLKLPKIKVTFQAYFLLMYLSLVSSNSNK